MKTIIIAASLTLLSIQQSQAQISIDPEAGINLSNYHIGNSSGSYTKFGYHAGPRLGASINIQAGSGFFIQPGLFYSVKGAGYSYPYYAGPDVKSAHFEGSDRLHYLEVPVNVGYQISLDKAGFIFITAGPYVGIATGGKVKGKYVEDGVENSGSGDIKFGNGGYNHIDAGLNFGLGYKSPWGVFVRAQYCFGLANVTSGTDATNRGFAFTLGDDIKTASRKK